MSDRAATPLEMIVSVVAVCAVAAAGLAATYGVTAERIEAQNRAAEEKALKVVLPNATAFTKVDEAKLAAAKEAAEGNPVDAVYVAADASGETVGWGIKTSPRGYGGPVQMVVGVDSAGKVTGVSIVTMNETPGLGTAIRDNKDFLPRFAGLDAATVQEGLKKVDSITGATKSSRAVRHGVEAAGLVYAKVLSGSGG